MIPKPIPELTEAQWKFLEEQLDKPAPIEMQAHLKQAIEDARKLKRS